jgi:hypothetical protein
VGSCALNTRGAACVGIGDGSGCWSAGTGSLGLGWGVGEFCIIVLSSATGSAFTFCASSEALVLLFRAGTAFGSFGSTGFRGFLVFFSGSGTFGSFGFGFGPGFLRGCPDAVRPRGAGDVVFAGVGVLVFAGPTPTPVLESRVADVGVPSGECGGELRLPGEDASFASIVAEVRKYAKCANTPGYVADMHNSDTKTCTQGQIRRASVRVVDCDSRYVAG